MNRYLCIHGHFYQPPRENAWLEKIEIQPSAYPYHDWNERITRECYYPNAYSRVLNDEGKIIDIVDNYSKISFNMGATLLSWMEQHAPVTYQAILDSDKQSMENFGGHGSAVGQVYNHMIMPLANRRDKETQIIWGIEDFKRRFNRMPEGMWLGEAAVDTETLELLVDHGIKYSLLAPRQAKRFRKVGESSWHDGVNSNLHYWYKLPNGKKIALFFYDGERSQNVAFKGLLENGRNFANDLLEAFQHRDGEQLVHIATDGESYGHHHKNGDMALAYCLRHIEQQGSATITNYGQYLSLFEPEHEIEIHEDSSWSCVHGVERWRSNCGCHTGGEGHWHQKWREPLRDALDYIREQMIDIYEDQMADFSADPWKARDEYIHVVLDRSKSNLRKFISKHTKRTLTEDEKTKFMRMLEMQRHAQLMYASCGWFFNDISGIETLQVLQYASRAMQLAESESNVALEPAFLDILDKAPSNKTTEGTGKDIYLNHIKPYQLSLTQVGMHYAVASLFADNPESLTVLNYDCKSIWYDRKSAGMQKLAYGTTEVHSKVTLSKKEFSFVVLYLGQHHLIGGTCDRLSKKEFEPLQKSLNKAFDRSNIARVIDIIKENFQAHNFSFFGMFKDEQMQLVDHYLEQSMELAYDSYRKIYDRNYNILNVLKVEKLKIPEMLRQNVEMVINIELKDVLTNGHFSLEKFEDLVEEAQKWEVSIDKEPLNSQLNIKLEKLFSQYLDEVSNVRILEELLTTIRLSKKIGLAPILVNLQNAVFTFSKSIIVEADTPFDGQKVVMELIDQIAAEINIDLTGLKQSALVV